MSSEKYAIDFDSAITNIYKLGSGMVLSEPTVCTVEDGTEKVKNIGLEASKLIGKTTKNTKIVFPVFEGEIVNEKVATGLLRGFLEKAGMKNKLFSGVSVLFGVPCGATHEMIEKYVRVAKLAGVQKVYFAESPMLSAIGQRIPFTESKPCFIIDLAGGTTNIAILSMDGIIAGVSANFGGNKISTDIIDVIEEKFGMQIGLQTAEKLKKEIGSLEEDDTLSLVVNGRDLESGAPKSISVRACDIYEPIKNYFDRVSEIAMNVLTKIPPEVSAEIRHAGIYVSGCTSQIYGLEKYYSEKFSMKINIPEDGTMAVALGGGIAIGDNDLLKKIVLEYD